MPSTTHEALLLLFRNRPELAPELLRDALGVELPAWSEARVEAADLAEVVPTEYRADLVVLLVDGVPVFAVVVEAQLKKNVRKAFTWPVYIAGLRARFECDACVLVVTPSEAVASWARAPISLGPGSTVTPFVVGPAAIPVIRDPAAARRHPELAILSVMAHGKDEVAFEIASAALAGCVELDGERMELYLDLVAFSLNDAARTAFEELMGSGTYEYQTEFVRKLAAQRAKERAEGRAEGLAEGLAEGRAEGRATDVITVLETRGVAVSDEERARILSCTDLRRLDRWIRSAVTVTSTADLFED